MFTFHFSNINGIAHVLWKAPISLISPIHTLGLRIFYFPFNFIMSTISIGFSCPIKVRKELEFSRITTIFRFRIFSCTELNLSPIVFVFITWFGWTFRWRHFNIFFLYVSAARNSFILCTWSYKGWLLTWLVWHEDTIFTTLCILNKDIQEWVIRSNSQSSTQCLPIFLWRWWTDFVNHMLVLICYFHWFYICLTITIYRINIIIFC